jgi:serine/threonine-protein kinase/endoribonuclease IRE1
MASCYDKDFFRSGQALMSLTPHQQRNALAGVHSLNGPRIVRSPMPRIAGSSTSELSNDTPREALRSPSELALPPALRNSAIIRKSWDNALDIVVTLILLFICTFIYFNSHHLRDLAKQKLDIKNIINSNDKASLSTPSTPLVGASPDLKRPSTPTQQVPNVTVNLDMDGSGPNGDANKVSGNHMSPDSTPRVKIREPSRGPDDEEGDENEKPKKKGRARGSRGGKSHRRRRKPGSEGDTTEIAEQVIDQVNTLAPQSRLEPDVQMTRQVSNEIMEMDGVIRIGRL